MSAKPSIIAGYEEASKECLQARAKIETELMGWCQILAVGPIVGGCDGYIQDTRHGYLKDFASGLARRVRNPGTAKNRITVDLETQKVDIAWGYFDRLAKILESKGVQHTYSNWCPGVDVTSLSFEDAQKHLPDALREINKILELGPEERQARWMAYKRQPVLAK